MKNQTNSLWPSGGIRASGEKPLERDFNSIYPKLLISQGGKMELYASYGSEFPVIDDV